VARRRVARDPLAALSGGIASETTHGGRDDGAVVRENFLPLPVDRTLELRLEFGENLGDVDVRGARVKPILFVPEEKADLVDREALRAKLIERGAVYVKAPTVHVIRKAIKRDERHRADVPLEESLRLFAGETRPRDADAKGEFAAALAREADAAEGG
jgi:hypothetical protein